MTRGCHRTGAPSASVYGLALPWTVDVDDRLDRLRATAQAMVADMRARALTGEQRARRLELVGQRTTTARRVLDDRDGHGDLARAVARMVRIVQGAGCRRQAVVVADFKTGTLRIINRLTEAAEARDPVDRQRLADHVLAQHDERWNIVLQFDAGSDRVDGLCSHGRHEHLLIGIHDGMGAAVLHKFKNPSVGDFVITGTTGEDHSLTSSKVPLDDSASIYFLTNRLISKELLRKAVPEYALTGSIAESVLMTPFDWHEDHYRVDFPDEVTPGPKWPAPGELFSGGPPF